MNNRESQKVMDALRILMYGDSGNLVAEIEDCCKLLEKYDGVKYNSGEDRLSKLVNIVQEIQNVVLETKFHKLDF